MDEIVKQAIAKWPNVPSVYGWLGLDQRGQWHLRDAAAQAAGGFASGAPGAKGSLIEHEKLVGFIGRNYERDGQGRWFFQNGPQRVYVELEAAPLVWRLDERGAPIAHTGSVGQARGCVVDETGRLYLDSDIGFGLVHSLYVAQAADFLESGVWNAADSMAAAELPGRFGFVPSPLASHLSAREPRE